MNQMIRFDIPGTECSEIYFFLILNESGCVKVDK